ncbi:MAG: hypothetical protein U9R25_17070 [Chloroflexota bacterium]|nr:hypothetical protein [Chloroflexota bacterium]
MTRSIRIIRLAAFVFLFCAGMFFGLAASVEVAWAEPADPEQLPATGDCYRDNIFYGEVPPGGDQSPVLVFVHGYGGEAIDWWLRIPFLFNNDSYVRAYDAGYRTAFVNLNVDPAAPDCEVVRTPAQSTAYNGYVLSQQIEAITEYFNVDQVDIIAHSKGGIDTQAAVVFWDAASYVRNVFSLSSPHQGSLLADLLWSPEGEWLAGLFGERDDGTYSIQTAPMQAFRSAVDWNPVDDSINYYSAAGTSYLGGGFGLRWMGQWIEDQPEGGPNDGAIRVSSTYLPYANVLFQEPWNHVDMFMGRNAFPYILDVLQGNHLVAPQEVAFDGPPVVLANSQFSITASGLPLTATKPFVYSWAVPGQSPIVHIAGASDTISTRISTPGIHHISVSVANGAGAAQGTFIINVVSTVQWLYFPFPLNTPGSAAVEHVAPIALNNIVRGGPLDQPVQEEIPIEPQVRSVEFGLFTSRPATGAVLVGPAGKVHPFEAVPFVKYGLPPMAHLQQVSIENPEPGSWQLQIDGQGEGGYLLIANLDSPLQIQVEGVPGNQVDPGEALNLTARRVSEGSQMTGRAEGVQEMALRFSSRSGSVHETKSAGAELAVSVARQEGVFGMSLSVRGQAESGFPYERTYVRSLLVADEGQLAKNPWYLDTLLQR